MQNCTSLGGGGINSLIITRFSNLPAGFLTIRWINSRQISAVGITTSFDWLTEIFPMLSHVWHFKASKLTQLHLLSNMRGTIRLCWGTEYIKCLPMINENGCVADVGLLNDCKYFQQESFNWLKFKLQSKMALARICTRDFWN